MGWEGHVSHTGERRGVTGFWWGNPKGRDDWEDPGIDRSIILKSIFRK